VEKHTEETAIPIKRFDRSIRTVRELATTNWAKHASACRFSVYSTCFYADNGILQSFMQTPEMKTRTRQQEVKNINSKTKKNRVLKRLVKIHNIC